MVQDLDKGNFDSTTSSGVSVVDFWAPWCGPCVRMAPAFEEAAGEADGATFAKVNIDENPDIAQKYGVMAIPTILFLKDGKVVDQHVGEMKKSDLLKKVESLS